MEDFNWAVGVVMKRPDPLHGDAAELSRAVRILAERMDQLTADMMEVMAEEPEVDVPSLRVRAIARLRRRTRRWPRF